MTQTVRFVSLALATALADDLPALAGFPEPPQPSLRALSHWAEARLTGAPVS